MVSLSTSQLLFDLHQYEKSNPGPNIYTSAVQELLTDYTSYSQIYTGGSKESDKVAASAYSEDCSVSVRLSDKTSISTTPLPTLLSVLDTINKTRKTM